MTRLFRGQISAPSRRRAERRRQAVRMAGEAGPLVPPPPAIEERFVPETSNAWIRCISASPQPRQVPMVAQVHAQEPPYPNDPSGDRMAGRHAPGSVVTSWGEDGAPRPAPSLLD